ncbi:hypothetical protein COW36_04420 [bacterium (Candidatus Blackallbacteria) CG17_big_fil_post_rev_8_21_14_2_50_48_46]|uniref:YbjN domain-containing protein n=1 Tax=bacterium (Candidatus Blackallbacteria) CG17_big_fil_post_rev_8_21_14_2_50_48_46 TaxID=2014261 RepID=A0A2M7G8X1_9BACT|nr:MAG: hypothetical protein COW64_04525 [bacterium (Candidatus Blackallbacteria) CG18_big_fil_WC_8_21_14_2_50_49_26]PIW18543.1 MAG: hypothetical protein COW36_04420 [bacterium (Candidatus Blackallbacteria) CG17_big_fil_post_rev_8_21_14_2_50_48_46]PIW46472.1 MAG: hypothetical protein COW20_16260 [bacterium (Candidatus Blackallbacteria) CG13_big_fil_rev_8_21_14_2_50_49_14]
MFTGVVPDSALGAESFLDDEIEYLEFENLIESVAERLDATWSYNLEDETYQIEFVDSEGTLHEAVSVSSEFCEEGFNEGRDLLICKVYLTEYSDAQAHVLPEILQLAQQLVFTKVSMNEHRHLFLVGKALYHQEFVSDVVTTMVEEMSSLAADFRLKLESASK